jgi:hypothetical protein
MSDIVPAGQYRAVAVPASVDGQKMWAQFGRSKEKLTPQVAVFFAILDDGPYRGRRLLWMGYFTENSTDRTIEALRLCGFKGDDLAALPNQDLDLEVSVTVENEEYEGKTRAKIAWVNAPGGGLKMSNPMNVVDLRKFCGAVQGEGEGQAGGGGSSAWRPPPLPRRWPRPRTRAARGQGRRPVRRTGRSAGVGARPQVAVLEKRHGAARRSLSRCRCRA